MSIKLVIHNTQNKSRQEFVCEQQLITIGRSKSCTLSLDNAGISRRHFIIRFNEGNYSIVDEGSCAGTILDGVMLDSKNCYQLDASHEISLPGFNITLTNDMQAPRQERTTVMARKLMGKILNDANDADNLPRLIYLDKNLVFYFHNDKASFVLGTLGTLDFVIDAECVAKEHVSFIRDISGVRIIPIVGAKIELNDREISEAEILNHNDKLTLGTACFIYQEYQDDEAIPKAQERINCEKAAHAAPMALSAQEQSSPVLNYLDRACWGLLLVTGAGLSYVAFSLLH